MQIDTGGISALLLGDMGVKTVALGGETVLERPGGYVYLILEEEEEKENGKLF